MIQSLLRAMELLELLKEANHKYSIAELSESTGLPPSTIHRILQTFCEKKYVIRDEHAHLPAWSRPHLSRSGGG